MAGAGRQATDAKTPPPRRDDGAGGASPDSRISELSELSRISELSQVSPVSHPRPARDGDADADAADAHRLAVAEIEAAALVMREDAAHDLAASVAFFGGFVRDLQAGRPVCAEDASIAAEELARARRLLAALRALPPPPLETAPVPIASALDTALRASASTLAACGADCRIDGPIPWVVSANRAGLSLMLCAMLRAAARGAPLDRHVIVTGAAVAGAITISVSLRAAAAPPVTRELPAWASPDDAVRALAAARRVARAHQFRLEDGMSGAIRTLRLTIPERFVVSGAPAGTEDGGGRPTGSDGAMV